MSAPAGGVTERRAASTPHCEWWGKARGPRLTCRPQLSHRTRIHTLRMAAVRRGLGPHGCPEEHTRSTAPVSVLCTPLLVLGATRLQRCPQPFCRMPALCDPFFAAYGTSSHMLLGSCLVLTQGCCDICCPACPASERLY